MSELRFLPLTNSQDEIERTALLLQSAFGKTDLFTEKFLDWQYKQNPDGEAVGFNAVAENELFAAHYVTQPMKAIVNGNEVNGLLSLNTATHADFRGKGLFTKLADETYKLAASKGYSFVIGVANAQSTHGFISKLGFQLVEPLQALIGIGNADFKNDQTSFEFRRVWNRSNLAWRMNNPVNEYQINQDKNHFEVLASSGKPMTKALLGCFENELFAEKMNQSKKNNSPFTLFLGTKESIQWKNSVMINIPMKFRPSPLNLIFKDLTGRNRKLTKGKIKFTAIDFDAF